jgi:hypothetical protein
MLGVELVGEWNRRQNNGRGRLSKPVFGRGGQRGSLGNI